MSNQIEGVPEGWEVVRIGKPRQGEWVVDEQGNISNWANVNQDLVWPILRKIEKPKKYRPFANAAEFKPHRDRWVCWKNEPGTFIKVHSFSNHCLWLGGASVGDDYKTLFKELVFEDGPPFGVEVSE